MVSAKSFKARFLKGDMLYPAIVAVLAALVFGGSVTSYAYPGESAGLLVKAMDLETVARDVPEHALWLFFARIAVAWTGSVYMCNMLSAVCGVASAWLLASMTIFYVRECCKDELASKYTSVTARVAGTVAGVAFVFAPPVWESSMHFGFRMFDVLCVLLVFRLLVSASRHDRKIVAYATAAGAATGACMVECPAFFTLSLVYLLAVAAIAHKSDCRRSDEEKPVMLPAVFAYLISLVAVFFALLAVVAAAYAGTPEAADLELASTGAAAVRMAVKLRGEMLEWFPRGGWMWLLVFGFLPVAASVFSTMAAFGAGRHKPSQCLFHVALTMCLIVAVAPSDFPVRPLVVLRPSGREPALLYTGIAAVTGYLAAYWWLLFRGPDREKTGADGFQYSVKWPRMLAAIMLGLMAFILPVSAAMDSSAVATADGAFADLSAKALVENMGERQWILTRGGRLDNHIRLAAKFGGKELHIVETSRTGEKAYRKALAALAERKGFAPEVVNAASVDVRSFFSALLESDSEAAKKICVYDIPDLWYESTTGVKCKPLPDGLFFAGAPDAESPTPGDALARKKRFLELWDALEPHLDAPEESGGMLTSEERQRADMRRQMGFVANNIAVYLQEAGLDREAFETYTLVNTVIDPGNISTVFNLYEMSLPGYNYRGSKKGEANPALRRSSEYRASLDDIMERAKNDPYLRYDLWNLSLKYGYINSPRGALVEGYKWARSGMPRAAIARIRKGIFLLPRDRQVELYNQMGMIYADFGSGLDSVETYNSVLESDPTNKGALRGLALLSLQNGDLDRAAELLERIEAARDGQTNLEAAFLALAKRDLDGARETLQKLAALSPNDSRLQGLLCSVILQQSDECAARAAKLAADAETLSEPERGRTLYEARKLEDAAAETLREAEVVVLPRLKALAERNDANSRFSYHFANALLLSHKGDEYARRARDEFFQAYIARPYVSGLADIVLRRDLVLRDVKAAESHARQVLAGNNHHVYANYVMGTIALRNGNLNAAVTFLNEAEREMSASGEGSPKRQYAPVLNDLAEVMRRMGRAKEAVELARRAISCDESLYVAHETLAAAMLDAKLDAKAALDSANRALEICQRENGGRIDMRLRITLARAWEANDKPSLALAELRKVKKDKSDDIGEFDREEMNRLDDILSGRMKQR